MIRRGDTIQYHALSPHRARYATQPVLTGDVWDVQGPHYIVVDDDATVHVVARRTVDGERLLVEVDNLPRERWENTMRQLNVFASRGFAVDEVISYPVDVNSRGERCRSALFGPRASYHARGCACDRPQTDQTNDVVVRQTHVPRHVIAAAANGRYCDSGSQPWIYYLQYCGPCLRA